jgi:hypothetical protein
MLTTDINTNATFDMYSMYSICTSMVCDYKRINPGDRVPTYSARRDCTLSWGPRHTHAGRSVSIVGGFII